MVLSVEAIEEFRAAWREAYGEDLSPDDAREYAADLLQAARVILALPRLSTDPDLTDPESRSMNEGEDS